VQRVTFNEITKNAITTAMKSPRQLDQELVDAYLARRALDYLVGFTLSPVLWRKLPGAKSAGRVQSVALRLIVDREREIESFVTREYWTVDGDFSAPGGQGFAARLVAWQGRKLDKFDLSNAALANEAKADVLAGSYKVAAVETKPVTRNPYPPFTTSTLQQEAARKLGMTATQTMRVAQQLYEDGAITYMRTDGVTIAGEAIAAARDVIAARFGANHVPDRPRVYTSKAKNAQEAHEAIRPTEMGRAPESAGLSGDHRRLYDLIWRRTLASQMASARLERTSVDLVDENGRATLRATGQVVLFPGFLALYQEDRDEPSDDEDGQRLPKLTQGDKPALKSAKAEQHFTQPPPRYSEASLVKKLEELGIGRPSTYASILQTLRDRMYVRMEKNRFFPEEKGRLVTAFLERFFERYVSYDFTAGLEERLDDISAGEIDWKTVLRDFWRDFQPKTKEILELKPSEVTQALDDFLASYLFPAADGDPRKCPACGDGRLALRTGKFGAFIACSNYPNCRYTRQFGENGEANGGTAADGGPRELGADPETGEAITLRTGRFGPFLQRGEGDKPARASIPRDIKPDEVDLATALRLLSLPRTIGMHPETGKPITASIGRYGPYLAHDGKYAKLSSTADVFETGMNAAVVKLAEPRGGGFERKAAAALREIGAHPTSGAAIRLMEGRYGPYVTDGTTNATVPKGSDPQALTADEAAALIDARAAAGPAKGKGRKAPARKAAPKAATAKKAPAKKAGTRKPAAKKRTSRTPA
jgi:DNA topoisomerase-1